MDYTNGKVLLNEIIKTAWQDESFKDDLIADPIQAIKTLTGKEVNIPEGKTIKVLDQTNDSVIYINIPAEPNLDDMELNEEQLEIIAGGDGVGPDFTDTSNNFTGIVGD